MVPIGIRQLGLPTLRCAAAIVLAAFFLPTLHAQQPGEVSYRDVSIMPDGALGNRIRSVIETLNANSPDAVQRFLQQECTERFRNIAPMKDHLSAFLGVHRQ